MENVVQIYGNVVQIPRLACSGDINSAISYAFKTLGYDRPTLEQERAIREFVSGRDIVVISPTGSGKVRASLRYLLCSTT